jgi:hypothetical protein
MRHGSHPVLTYALLAAAVGLAGCNGGSNGSMSKTPVPPVPPTNPTATNSLLVGNLSSASIYSLLQFSKTSSGASSPIGSLDLPADFSFSAITTDRLGQIYVGGAIPSPSTSPGPIYQWEVLVYAANSVGSAAPIRTVVGSSSSFETVISMTVDASGQLYISSDQPVPAIAVMSASANGAAKAVRVLSGSLTQLGDLEYGLVVDSAGTLFTADPNRSSILEFSATANGNVAPAMTISGANTGFDHLYGIDLDVSGNLYVLTNTEVPGVSSVTTIEEFASMASGNTAPIRTIGGDATGLSSFVSIVRVDSTGTIYVSGDGPPAHPFLESFSATASGNAAPLTTLTSTAWTGPGYLGLGLD